MVAYDGRVIDTAEDGYIKIVLCLARELAELTGESQATTVTIVVQEFLARLRSTEQPLG